MEYKKITLLIFLLISIFFNSSEFIGGKFDKLNMFYPYFQNKVITFITIATIILNLALILLLIIQISNRKLFENLRSYLISFLILLLITLIWFEIYYGSTFYYGEIRDKQAVWWGINNFGAIGSIIFTYSLYNFRKLRTKSKILLETLFLILVVVIHFAILNFLNDKWRIFF